MPSNVRQAQKLVAVCTDSRSCRQLQDWLYVQTADRVGSYRTGCMYRQQIVSAVTGLAVCTDNRSCRQLRNWLYVQTADSVGSYRTYVTGATCLAE